MSSDEGNEEEKINFFGGVGNVFVDEVDMYHNFSQQSVRSTDMHMFNFNPPRQPYLRERFPNI